MKKFIKLMAVLLIFTMTKSYADISLSIENRLSISKLNIDLTLCEKENNENSYKSCSTRKLRGLQRQYLQKWLRNINTIINEEKINSGFLTIGFTIDSYNNIISPSSCQNIELTKPTTVILEQTGCKVHGN